MSAVAREHPVSVGTLKLVVFGVEGLLCLAVALAAPPGRFPQPVPRDRELGGRAALEIGVAILLILLLSPMSSRSLFCTMLLPAFCLGRAGIIGRDRVALGCLAAAILCTVISFNAPFFKAFNREMLWLGLVTWSTLALLAGSLWLLWRHGLAGRVPAHVPQAAPAA